MTQGELRGRLSALAASDLERLLQIVVKEHVERTPEAVAYFAPDVLAAGLAQAAADAGVTAGAIAEPVDKAEALREIALELAEDPRCAALLGNALAADRPTRVDPITASIVLAGIVLVLQTRFDVRYDRDGGKKKLHIEIRKAPTTEKLLAKLFGPFQISK
jgi:hypothetical protein